MLLCWSVITIMIAAIDVSFMSVLAVDLKTAHNLGWPPSTPEPTTPDTTASDTTTPDTTTPDTVCLFINIYTSIFIFIYINTR